MTSPRVAIALALAAAALFGLATPASKLLLDVSDPWLLAGLLYLGSGVGLGAVWLIRALGVAGASRPARLTAREHLWLAGAIAAGGGAGPVLLMFGLAVGSASHAALLLNLEGVFTALLAWFIFREHFDRRIASGMAAITAGAALLSWNGAGPAGVGWSALLVVGACLAWALDNNLTRKISASDALRIAALKGAVAGPVNVSVALILGSHFPGGAVLLEAGLVGLLGYGVSLVLFILALRHLGSGRTAAYFSTAPFVGAAGMLMALGVWLHATERHEHEHAHEQIEHEHLHRHDEHHLHEHPPGTPPGEPHTHPHAHAPLRHSHPHFPDVHHRHGH